MKNFKLSNKGPVGTCLSREVVTSYNKLKAVFGPPNSTGDDYKISTEWIVEDEKGNIFTIYDWKETELYDPSYMSVEDLRGSMKLSWHIGVESNVNSRELEKFILK